MGYNITKTHIKHTSVDGPMSVDRQQRNISTPQHEISFHRVQRLHSVCVDCRYIFNLNIFYLSPLTSTVLMHWHDGQLPGGPTSIGSPR